MRRGAMRCIAIVGLVAGCDSATSRPAKPPTSMGSSGEPGVTVPSEERPRPTGGAPTAVVPSLLDAGAKLDPGGPSGGQ